MCGVQRAGPLAGAAGQLARPQWSLIAARQGRQPATLSAGHPASDSKCWRTLPVGVAASQGCLPTGPSSHTQSELRFATASPENSASFWIPGSCCYCFLNEKPPHPVFFCDFLSAHLSISSLLFPWAQPSGLRLRECLPKLMVAPCG